jgi:hypothetical protein
MIPTLFYYQAAALLGFISFPLLDNYDHLLDFLYEHN